MLRTWLPTIRANVMGRICEAATAKRLLVRDGFGPEARYYNPKAASSTAAE